MIVSSGRLLCLLQSLDSPLPGDGWEVVEDLGKRLPCFEIGRITFYAPGTPCPRSPDPSFSGSDPLLWPR